MSAGIERYARPVIIAGLGIVVWEVAVSFILCLGIGRLDLFKFPFDQWLQNAIWFDSMLWWPHTFTQWVHHPLGWFFIASVPTTAIAAGICWQLWQKKRGKAAEQPFGGMEWTSAKEQAEGGITRRRF